MWLMFIFFFHIYFIHCSLAFAILAVAICCLLWVNPFEVYSLWSYLGITCAMTGLTVAYFLLEAKRKIAEEALSDSQNDTKTNETHIKQNIEPTSNGVETHIKNYKIEKICNVIAATCLFLPLIFILCSILFVILTGIICFICWRNPFEAVSWWTYFRVTGSAAILIALWGGYSFAQSDGEKGYVVRLVEAEKTYRNSPCFKNNNSTKNTL